MLVFRSQTERPEGINTGTVKLVGTYKGVIVIETKELLDNQTAFIRMAQAVNPYGDGRASFCIVKGLLNYEK